VGYRLTAVENCCVSISRWGMYNELHEIFEDKMDTLSKDSQKTEEALRDNPKWYDKDLDTVFEKATRGEIANICLRLIYALIEQIIAII
jgi:prophage maintenance system killer protein